MVLVWSKAIVVYYIVLYLIILIRFSIKDYFTVVDGAATTDKFLLG